jgi:signal transduction histidine kinase/CheY-like chemotaxis protein
MALIQRKPFLWMLVSVVLAALGLWWFEWKAGLISAVDRFAYPLLVLWFAGLAVLLWRRPSTLPWIGGLGAAAGSVYFVGTAFSLCFINLETATAYQFSTLLQWTCLVHFFVYSSWPLRLAFPISVLTALGSCGPAAWVEFFGTPPTHWDATLWPLVINSFVNQVVFILAMSGLAKLRSDISLLTAHSPFRGDAKEALEAWLQAHTREIQNARAAAEDASRAKSRFLAVMSHELRTPLHAVLGAADLLRETPASHSPGGHPAADGKARPSRQALLNTLIGNGRHLLSLIEQVLDISRIEAGRVQALAEPFDLDRLAQESLQAVSPAAQAKGLRLDSEVSLLGQPWRLGDALRLRQVIINLLANAVKFTDTGSVSLRIMAQAGGSQVRVHVKDTGPGIPAEHQARIFDAFEQLSNESTRKHEGAGLGLAISRELVQLMGGQLALVSAPGQGSEFYFELPLAPTADQGAQATAMDAATAHRLDGLHLLLVDDDPINQLLAGEMLSRAGAKVSCADDGEAGLARLRQEAFDLVLMDWQMPLCDGLEVTRRLRRGDAGPLNQHRPVVGLTANAFVEDRQACLEAGMNEVVTKPVQGERLIAAVARWAGADLPQPQNESRP